MQQSLIVIGGGAAGIFCAVNAARLAPELKVTVVEKTGKLLAKVKISGGGRCNVTHACFDVTQMSRRYPRGQNFIKRTFHHFFTTDTIQWFGERGVPLKTESDGRMFPVTDSSQTIIDCLLKEGEKYGVTILLHTEVGQLERKGDHFSLGLRDGGELKADYVCVACGGYPKRRLFDWLIPTGHTVSEPTPSLFTFNLPQHPINALMGVSVGRARVKLAGSKLAEEGPVLITHWGLSGPAVLRLSAWGARELADKDYQFKAHISWLPEFNDQSLKNEFLRLRNGQPAKTIGNYSFQLPARLWVFLLETSGISPVTRFADLPAKSENRLIRNLVDYVVEVQGKTTFKEEFVTAGGIQLAEVDANSMMSRKVENLFFAGETLDVDGITGGYNFQHAWTSGWLAAKAISEKVKEGQEKSKGSNEDINSQKESRV